MIRSSLGGQLERAELFSTDEYGKRVPKAARNNWHEIKVRSTRTYAPAPTTLETIEDEVQRQRDEQELRDLLTPEENAVRDLQLLRYTHAAKCQAPVEDIEQLLQEGWMFVKQEHGIAHFESGELQHSSLSYAEIGERLGLSPRQVHTRVITTNRKIRGGR